MVVLTFVVVAGISAVGYADKSISSFSLAPLYLLPLALSALIHPFELALRFRLPVSVCTTFSAQFVMLESHIYPRMLLPCWDTYSSSSSSINWARSVDAWQTWQKSNATT